MSGDQQLQEKGRGTSEMIIRCPLELKLQTVIKRQENKNNSHGSYSPWKRTTKQLYEMVGGKTPN